MRTVGAALLLASILTAPAFGDPALDALVAACPDRLATYDDKTVVWKDGSRSTVSDGNTKSFGQLLDSPDIEGQFAIPHPLGTDIKVPAVNEDPGRIRNESFFLKRYGDCRKGEVAKCLKAVKWLPSRGGGTVMATMVNGVADRFAEVSRELKTLPASMTRYMALQAQLGKNSRAL